MHDLDDLFLFLAISKYSTAPVNRGALMDMG